MSATETTESRPGDTSDGPSPATPEVGDASGPADELTTLRRECEALRDKNLRLLAEGRNMQQRAARDKEEAIKYAEFDFARELLPVVDGLERTLASAKSASDIQ